MKYTIKPVLVFEKTIAEREAYYKNKKKSDPHLLGAVKICLTIKRKRHYETTALRVTEDQWDEALRQVRKNHSASSTMNSIIRNKISEVEAAALSILQSGRPFNVKTVARELTPNKGTDDFFKYAEPLIVDMKKKYSEQTMDGYDNLVKKLKKYQPDLHFSDIDTVWLRKFEGSLWESGLANNTVHKLWKQLKKIFNCAISDKVIDEYPFKGYDNPKYIQTIRTFLVIEEVWEIEKLLKMPLSKPLMLTINYFLLGCYSGLRVGDWQRFNYEGFVQGNRILLGADKNGKIISYEMQEQLREVVERLKDLPPAPSDQILNDNLKIIGDLAGIKKVLTTHVARHTFATNCLRLKMQDDVICHLMGITKKTLMIYKHLLDADIDEEMKKWNQQKLQRDTKKELRDV